MSVWSWALWAALAWGHDTRPGAVAIEAVGPTSYAVSITAPQDGSGLPPRLVPRWPAGCAYVDRLLRCEVPLAGEVSWQGAGGRWSQVVVRVRHHDGSEQVAVSQPGQPRVLLGGGTSSGSAVAMGLGHLAEGTDHQLFVAALVAWARRPWAIAVAVTCFTLGHAVTFGAAASGWIWAPSAAVEVLIAASVVWLAREVLADPDTRLAPPWAFATVCGLLHGMGFAGAWREVAEAQGASGWAAFHLGLELGQLAVVGAAAGVWWALGRALGGPARRRVFAYGIGLPAGVWMVGRALEMWASWG